MSRRHWFVPERLDVLDLLRRQLAVTIVGVFALSRAIDWILDYARDLVSESEAMACSPGPVIADMARLLTAAVHRAGRGRL